MSLTQGINMPLVTRLYNEPDQLRTVVSTESTGKCCSAPPYTHVELARRRRGSYEGVRTPRFSSLRSSGELLPLSYYRRYDLLATQAGRRSLMWYDGCGGGCYRSSSIASCNIIEDFGLMFDDHSLESVIPSYERQMSGLLTEAAANSSDAWDILTFIKEAPQAKEMFERIGESILDLLRKKPTKSGSNAWLQWQMGWKPLWEDLKSIVEMLNKAFSDVERTRGKSVWRDSRRININRSRSLPSSEVHTIIGTDTTTVELTGHVVADIRVAGNRLELNPLVSTWEMVPHSFVVDYFFKVGSWIQSFSVTSLYQQSVSAVGVRVLREVDVTLRGSLPSTAGSLKSYTAFGSANIRGELRVRIPRPITLSPPPFRGFQDLSVTRIVNLVALVFQQLR